MIKKRKFFLLILIALLLISCEPDLPADAFGFELLPAFGGQPYCTVNNGKTFFTEEEKANTSEFEIYPKLDELGRCGTCYANVSPASMPTEARSSISSVKPTGWVQGSYPTSVVSGGYLYNRCHLIGYQLTAESARKENLITGTKYMNNTGMLPFENMVADYVKESGNHVLYRVTPDFRDNELVARGVLIEAYSVEDKGDGIDFCVYCYNVQPQIEIDYLTGNNRLAGAAEESPKSIAPSSASQTAVAGVYDFVINKSSKKAHLPGCSYASTMSEKNRLDKTCTLDKLLSEGYTLCSTCAKKIK